MKRYINAYDINDHYRALKIKKHGDVDAVISEYEILSITLQAIDMCNTADVVEVEHAEWLKHPDFDEWYVCSVCGIGCMRQEITNEAFTEYGYQYCPHCGAKMDGKAKWRIK